MPSTPLFFCVPHHAVAMACVLVLLNVGKPWSEDTPGLDFEMWWWNAFGHGSEWPGLTWTDLQGLQQQQEWVTAWSTRPGINALAKPLGALSLSAQEGVSPPPGGGVVKLVRRQVQRALPANELKLTADGRKLVGVLQLAQGMGPMEVSRDNPIPQPTKHHGEPVPPIALTLRKSGNACIRP